MARVTWPRVKSVKSSLGKDMHSHECILVGILFDRRMHGFTSKIKQKVPSSENHRDWNQSAWCLRGTDYGGLHVLNVKTLPVGSNGEIEGTRWRGLPNDTWTDCFGEHMKSFCLDWNQSAWWLRGTDTRSDWVSSFLTARQHNIGYTVPYLEKDRI